MTVLTREDLFQRAWDRPLTDVAAELGVTSTALKKTCDRHDIPTPGRGYWAQVRAGKTFPRPKLRPPRHPRLEQVNIFGAPPLPPAVETAQELTRQAARIAKAQPPAPATAPTEEGAVAAPAPPEPNVLVATRKALAKAKPSSNGFLNVQGKGLLTLRVGEPSAERAVDLAAALARQAHAQGWELQAGEAGLVLVATGERIAFRIEDKPRRTLHTPTDKELKRKAEETWRRSDPWPTYDEAPSGELSLVIDANDYSGLRKTFSDGKLARLEDKLADILAAFAGHAALIQERQREREAQRRQAEEAEARRQREKAFAERETRRGEFVGLVAAKLEERARLEAVLAHVERVGASEPARLPGMASWIRRKMAEIDALLTARFLDISRRASKLDFDEADALARVAADRWFYAPEVELHLWAIDEANNQAHGQSAYEWARDQGLVPDAAPPSATE